MTALLAALSLAAGYLLGWRDRGRWERDCAEMDGRLRQACDGWTETYASPWIDDDADLHELDMRAIEDDLNNKEWRGDE
jgi:hypothetical protein